MRRSFMLLLVTALLSCKTGTGHLKPKASGLQVAGGTVERLRDFPSKFVPDRNVDVWLPQHYVSGESYNVLYMHDGQMLYDSSVTWNGQEWGVDETLSRLIADGEIEKTIVVGIWNSGEDRFLEYFPQKPFMEVAHHYPRDRSGKKKLFSETAFSDAYLRFLVQELKPYIDKNYATRPQREHTFIAGSSMGGLISWYAVTEYPEIFGGAASLSTHWPVFGGDSEEIFNMFLGYLRDNLPAPGSHKFYFDYGTETLDASYEPYQRQIDSLMSSYGFAEADWQTRKFEGADHSENSWKERLEIPLLFLLKNRTRY